MSRPIDAKFGVPEAIIVSAVRSTEKAEPTLPCIFCRYNFAAKDEADFRRVELTSLRQVELDTNTEIGKKSLIRGPSAADAFIKYRDWVHFPVAASISQRHIARLPEHRRQRVELDCALVKLVTKKNATDVLAMLERRWGVTVPTLSALIESLEHVAMSTNEVEELEATDRHQFLRRQIDANAKSEMKRQHVWREFGESLVLVLLARTLGCELHVDSWALVFPFDEVVVPGSFAAELSSQLRASETRVADPAGTNIYLPPREQADAVSKSGASPAKPDTTTRSASDL